jgi:hypothetical protein
MKIHFTLMTMLSTTTVELGEWTSHVKYMCMKPGRDCGFLYDHVVKSTIKGNIYLDTLELSAFPQTNHNERQKEPATVLHQNGTALHFSCEV